MDPITLAIVSALAAGVTAGGSKVAEQAIVDGYNALKSLIERRFGGGSELAKAVDNLESKPDSEGRKAMLDEEVAASHAEQDAEILAAAVKLLELVQSQAGAQVTYHAEVKGGGAIAQGKDAIAVGAGGVLVKGDVDGDVMVGGTKILQSPDPRQLEAERVEQARRRYLEQLRQTCQVLPLAALGGEEVGEEDVTLERVYIALDTTTRVELTKVEKKKREKESRFRLLESEDTCPLSALEVAKAHARVALLGDPGAGKSTFLRNLLAWQAAAQLGEATPPLEIPGDLPPVLIVLRDLVPRLANLDLEALPQRHQRQALIQVVQEQIQEDLRLLEAEEYSDKLFERLQSGECLLALDGLDEVPASLRPLIRLVVAALLEKYHIQRILLTCRTRSYIGEVVVPGFAAHTLAPFNEDKVLDFATGWYRAQKDLRRVTAEQAREKAQDLAQAALGADLRELSSNPMMLTAMAIIHQKEIGLPRERVRLYNLVVDVLLRRWQKQKTGERGLAPSPELVNFLKDDLRLRVAMERLAYEAHRSRQGEAEAANLLRGSALTLLEAPQYLGQAELAAEFLDYVDQRAGLLLGRGGELGRPQTYAFPHRTFQEYLAGCYLAGQRDLAREFYARAGEGSDWSLAAQLGLEELQYNRRNTNALLDLAYQLGVEAEGEQSQRSVLWAGNIAVLVGSEAILSDAASPQGGPLFLERLQSQLVRLLGGVLNAPERAEAGRDLGILGDPRFDENAWLLPNEPLLGFAHIPAGPFLMGSDPDKDRVSTDREQPQHKVDLPEFYIARYPVTVAQFRAFVEASAYQPRDPHSLSGIPNHPAVLVTWSDALAYCRWLEGQLRAWPETPEPLASLLREKGWRVSLPSEAQWEKAARGTDGRLYPWGDEPNPEKANYGETGIGRTSAVGCFPGGASSFDVLDMSGNVWEWTRSLWGKDWKQPDFKYPYRVEDGREDIEAGDDIARVLRGGSFYYLRGNVRCAYRSRYYPDYWYYDIGFRVVVSPSGSGL